MKVSEFSAAVKRDRQALADRNPPSGLLTCASCKVLLQESVTGTHRQGDKKFYCSDCYFDAFDGELVAHPITSGRAPRGRSRD